MPSTAQSAQQSALRVETAELSAITITGITQADPPVVSFTGTDPANGDIIEISGVVGMTEVNGRAYVVANLSASTSFELKGVKASGYTAYASAGTGNVKTMTKVGNVKDFDIQQDEAAERSRTNLDSVRQEFALGLPGSWTMSCNYDIDTTDTGQDEFEDAQDDGLTRAFSLTLASGYVFCGLGYVKSTSASGSPDTDVSGVVNIRGTNQPSWFV